MPYQGRGSSPETGRQVGTRHSFRKGAPPPLEASLRRSSTRRSEAVLCKGPSTARASRAFVLPRSYLCITGLFNR